MSNNRIDRVFSRLKATGRTGLLPYITGGYPNLDATVALLRSLSSCGASVIEVGFPFSDSIADGPVIQDSFHRALSNGLKVEHLFEAVATARRDVDVALVAMVSCSIIDRIGLKEFVDRSATAGFDGLIVPDVPLEEAQRFVEETERVHLKNIMLVASSTPPDRSAGIAAMSSGFLYQIAVAGTTGERASIANNLPGHIAQLRSHCNLPICVGFGIGNPEQVAEVAQFADGVIVGSAIVRRITQAVDKGSPMEKWIESVTGYVTQMVAAT